MSQLKLVCFDIDGTLIADNSWRQLNLALGITPEEDDELFTAYQRGDLTYDAWLARLSELYQARGLATREHIAKTLRDYTLQPGSTAVVSDLKERGYTVALVSGSFDLFVADVAARLGVSGWRATTQLEFDAAGQLTKLAHDSDESDAKLRQLSAICAEQNVALSECACVGDGGNNLALFQATGHGITFPDAPADLQATAWQTVAQLPEVPSVL